MRYWELRAVELIDPRSCFGKPWNQLQYDQQVELLAYAMLRMEEKAGPGEDDLDG